MEGLENTRKMDKFNNILATQIGRGNDPTGHGYYGASRGKGKRKHKGFDVISAPNEKVFAPNRGRVRVGNVYESGKPNKPDMKLVEITGETFRNKIMYVSPLVKTGDFVEAGQLIGVAQDITDYHTTSKNDPDQYMINHIHVSTWKNGLLTDPEPLLKLDWK